MKGLFVTNGVLRMSYCHHRGQAEPRPEGKKRENSTMWVITRLYIHSFSSYLASSYCVSNRDQDRHGCFTLDMYYWTGKSGCCSVAQSCSTLCNSMDCSTPGFPVLHHLLELVQTHVRWIGDAIQPSCPLSNPSPAFSLSQHQGLF